MSRLMSPAAIRAMFSADSDADLIVLLTVYDPVTPTKVVARLCDGYIQRLEGIDTIAGEDLITGEKLTTDDDIIYGVRSRNNNFVFLPMEISLPSEQEAQAPRSSIVLRDVTRYITPIIRDITGPPKILMELVLSTTPNVVEASFSGFYINSFTYNAETVTAELSMIDYDREPFPQHSFSPIYFPGLF